MCEVYTLPSHARTPPSGTFLLCAASDISEWRLQICARARATFYCGSCYIASLDYSSASSRILSKYPCFRYSETTVATALIILQAASLNDRSMAKRSGCITCRLAILFTRSAVGGCVSEPPVACASPETERNTSSDC
jgi:hypothetical protein